MADDADIAGNNVDEFNADAFAEHQRKMEDMELLSGEYECDDCGCSLPFVTKARLAQPRLLCGTCSDYYSSKNLSKFRGEY